MNNTDQIEEITKFMCKFKQEPYESLPCEKCCYNDTCHYQSIAKDLCEADFVKVVRCKDCIDYIKEDGYCFARGIHTEGTDFCSDGERREGHDS